MVIEAYSFGSITIDGETYTSDVIILPDRVVPSWRRETGHSLSLDDLDPVLESEPDLLLIGTGAYGVMRAPGQVLRELKERGMAVEAGRTVDMVSRYAAESPGRRVAAALHLTC